jgi:thioredoxin-related protein
VVKTFLQAWLRHMKKLLFLVLGIPFFVHAQETGIKFEQNTNWHEILEKSKAKHMMIFVDCFATWCGPCKKMDKEVYSNDTVGTYINANFISVKIQMDTSKSDNEDIKNWYAEAYSLKEEYKVEAYPTYLFFSPDGQILDRNSGYQEVHNFISMATNAIDPNQQYYTLLRDYKQGIKNFSRFPFLAYKAASLSEKALSAEIANDYVHNYLEKQSEADYCSKEHLDFIMDFKAVLKSDDRIIHICLHNPEKVDSLENKGFANNIVNDVVYKEEIAPHLTLDKGNSKDPDWIKITRSIENKYGKSYVKYNIVKAKVDWYRSKKDWKNYAKYLVQRVENNGPEKVPKDYYGMIYLNGNAFEVFRYSDNKKELEKALSWINLALLMTQKPFPSLMDTRANILYKLGRKTEATALEKEAASLSPKDKEIQTAFEKMKMGLPTWPVEL